MTAELTFARTRIQPPRLRGDLINRPALDKGLQRALAEQRLTLIVAPAGWGKTSSLARQVTQLPAETALAWISADADDDVQRFLAGLAAALAPFDLPWRVSPSALGTLLQSERGTRAVADEIVNALTDSEVSRGLLCIDDTHRWKEPKLFELLAAVVEHLPPHWGVVLASRTEPPLPIARWRARGELAEFRQSTLRFDVEEIRELLQSRGLATDNAEELHKRTHGWAVGLRLMLSVGTLTGQSAGRSQRDVFDYLATEVLTHMSPDMQQFLLRCSVLPELTAERCAHVSGLANAAALFAQLEREGLFVTPLDDSGTTLRLHDLFRDFLEERLQREHFGDVPALLLRAADDEPNLLRAVTWLTRAGAADRAEAELAARGQALLRANGLSDLMRMFAMIPAARIDANPDLALLRGQCAFQFLDFAVMLDSMTAAERGYAERGNPMAVIAGAMKYAAMIHRGLMPEARAGFEQLRKQFPAGPPAGIAAYCLAYIADWQMRVADVVPELRELVTQIAAAAEAPILVEDELPYFLGLSYYPGAAAQFERYARLALDRSRHRVSPSRIAAHHVRAAIALGRGQLDEAREHLGYSDEDIAWLGWYARFHEENNSLRGLIDGLSGDASAASKAAERAFAALRSAPNSYQRVHSTFSLSQALRIYWLIGDADGVRRMRNELHADSNPWEWGIAPMARAIADGMVALLDDDPASAERLLLPAGEQNRWSYMGLGAFALLLGAEAQRRQNELDAAAATLRSVLSDPHLPQAVGAALVLGKTTIRHLASAAWGKRLNSTQQAELDRWASLLGGASVAAQSGVDRLPAGLTSREAEVLELVSKGQSNKLIARDLSLSLFTVKRHVANILAKTELTSRTELATWWVAKRKSPN